MCGWGNVTTALEMAGASLTLTMLDEELRAVGCSGEACCIHGLRPGVAPEAQPSRRAWQSGMAVGTELPAALPGPTQLPAKTLRSERRAMLPKIKP